MKKCSCLIICLLLGLITGCAKAHPVITTEKHKLIHEELVYYKAFLELAKPLVEVASDDDKPVTEKYVEIVDMVNNDEFKQAYQSILTDQKRIIQLDDVNPEDLAAFAGATEANIRTLNKYVDIEANVAELQKSLSKDFEICIKSILAQGLKQDNIDHLEELVETYQIFCSNTGCAVQLSYSGNNATASERLVVGRRGDGSLVRSVLTRCLLCDDLRPFFLQKTYYRNNALFILGRAHCCIPQQNCFVC